MKYNTSCGGFCLWLSARETSAWAVKPGATWPCSFLAGKRLWVEFDSGGLVNIMVNGGRGDQDVPSDELSAMVSDFAKKVLPKDHPCYDVVVR